MQCSVTILDQSILQNNELGLKFHSLLEMEFHPLTHNTQHVELKTALSKHFDFYHGDCQGGRVGGGGGDKDEFTGFVVMMSSAGVI